MNNGYSEYRFSNKRARERSVCLSVDRLMAPVYEKQDDAIT